MDLLSTLETSTTNTRNLKKINIETLLEVYNQSTELPGPIQELINKAQQARKNAYAPYSNFMVGAAILLHNNQIVIGNNQENAAFPSGLCAERVAVYYAGAQFPTIAIKAIAIVAGSVLSINTTPIAPCGSCRQSLAEYEVKQKTPIEVYFMGEQGKVIKSGSIKNLLPLVFDNSYLK